MHVTGHGDVEAVAAAPAELGPAPVDPAVRRVDRVDDAAGAVCRQPPGGGARPGRVGGGVPLQRPAAGAARRPAGQRHAVVHEELRPVGVDGQRG